MSKVAGMEIRTVTAVNCGKSNKPFISKKNTADEEATKEA